MTRAPQPVLTVRTGPVQRTFSAGRDVIVGSDMAADLRIAHPLVGRAHLLLRFEQGNWIAIDNNSPNGIFVDGRRVPLVDIHDGLTVNLARPDGPRVAFEVGHHQGIVGLIPETDRIPAAEPPPPRPPG
ncbi:FHA domain-containing protein, partial [Mycobacterium gordonae]